MIAPPGATLVFTDDSEIEYLFGTHALRIEDTGATHVVRAVTARLAFADRKGARLWPGSWRLVLSVPMF